MNGLSILIRSAGVFVLLVQRGVIALVMLAMVQLPAAHACSSQGHAAQIHITQSQAAQGHFAQSYVPQMVIGAAHHGHDGAKITGLSTYRQGEPAHAPLCVKKCCLANCFATCFATCIGTILPAMTGDAGPAAHLAMRWFSHDETRHGVIQRVATPPPRAA